MKAASTLGGKTQISTTTFFIICLFPLLFLSTLNATFTAFRSIGFISISVILFGSNIILLAHYALGKKITKIHLEILLSAIPFISVAFIGLFINTSSRSFTAIFQMVALIGFFMFSCLIKWDDYKIKTAKRLSVLFILLMPLTTDISYIGAYIAFALFFVLLERKKSFINFILTILSVVLIYLSEQRAVLLLLGSAAFTYMVWNFINRTRFRYILFFFVLMSGLLSFIFIYPNLIYWSHFYVVNDFVRTYTGGNLMSGRNDIWIVLTNLIEDKPLLGYGTGILPPDVTAGSITLSSHNLYIQTSLQNGYVGLALLLFLFFVIWLILRRSNTEFATRLSASFFVGILLYQSFEVVLTQNKMDTALMQWFIISVGVSSSLYSVKKQQPIR